MSILYNADGELVSATRESTGVEDRKLTGQFSFTHDARGRLLRKESDYWRNDDLSSRATFRVDYEYHQDDRIVGARVRNHAGVIVEYSRYEYPSPRVPWDGPLYLDKLHFGATRQYSRLPGEPEELLSETKLDPVHGGPLSLIMYQDGTVVQHIKYLYQCMGKEPPSRTEPVPRTPKPPAKPDDTPAASDEQTLVLPEVAQLQEEMARSSASGRVVEAIALAERILELEESALGSEHPTLISSLIDLALMYSLQARFAETESLCKRAQAIATRSLGANHPVVASIQTMLGGAYMARGQFAAAQEALEGAQAILESRFGSRDLELNDTLVTLAELYRWQGRYDEAESLLQRSQGILEYHFAPVLQKSLSLLALANVYRDRGKYAEAEHLYTIARRMFEESVGSEHPFLAAALRSLAALYRIQARYDEAESLYWKSMAIVERSLGAENPMMTSILIDIATLYKMTGRYEEADELFQHAVPAMEQSLGPTHPGVARSLQNWANLLLERGEYARAETLTRRALDIWAVVHGPDSHEVARSLDSLAMVYSLQGRYDEAYDGVQRALAIKVERLGPEHPLVANTLMNFAFIAFSQGDIDRTIVLAERAESSEDEHLSAMMQWGSEKQRHQYLAYRTLEVDMALTLALRAPERASDLALRYMLRHKGRVQDAMRTTLAAVRATLDEPGLAELNAYIAVRAEYAHKYLQGRGELSLAEHREDLARIALNKQTLERKLSARSMRFAQGVRTISLDQIRAALPERAVLIEWLRYNAISPEALAWDRDNVFQTARYAACLVARDRKTLCLDLADARTVDTLAFELHRTLSLDLEGHEVLARKLHALVVEPLLAHLGDTRELYLAPDGELHFVPFAALLHGDPDEPRYLVEDYLLTYVTSGRDLIRISGGSVRSSPAVIIGDPEYDMGSQQRGSAFRQLAATALEARDIHGLLPGSKLLSGARASERAVKQLRAPRILHLATHGYFGARDCQGSLQYTDNPLLASGLALAGANACSGDAESDGILTGEEVAALDLYGTELVVLSACDTGLGTLQAKVGESQSQSVRIGIRDGVFGLRRALMLAGAETQMVSLWKVDDRATHALMTAYYKILLQHVGRSEALRQVQLTMLRRRPDRPHYWASFIVAGSNAPMHEPRNTPATVRSSHRGCTCDASAPSGLAGWLPILLALAWVRRARRAR